MGKWHFTYYNHSLSSGGHIIAAWDFVSMWGFSELIFNSSCQLIYSFSVVVLYGRAVDKSGVENDGRSNQSINQSNKKCTAKFSIWNSFQDLKSFIIRFCFRKFQTYLVGRSFIDYVIVTRNIFKYLCRFFVAKWQDMQIHISGFLKKSTRKELMLCPFRVKCRYFYIMLSDFKAYDMACVIQCGNQYCSSQTTVWCCTRVYLIVVILLQHLDLKLSYIDIQSHCCQIW